jgi:hypothetical protein
MNSSSLKLSIPLSGFIGVFRELLNLPNFSVFQKSVPAGQLFPWCGLLLWQPLRNQSTQNTIQYSAFKAEMLEIGRSGQYH